jgi:3-methyladenine DNA glycosylase/8-oxoguanine DNA glycosylase
VRKRRSVSDGAGSSARLCPADASAVSPAMEAIAESWRPHRTLACRYLWRALDNEPIA